MKKTLALSVLFLFVAGLGYADDIINPGFESGLDGWFKAGSVANTSIIYIDPRTDDGPYGSFGPIHEAVTGSSSAMIGNSKAAKWDNSIKMSSIRQTWTVTDAFKKMVFYYAAVGLVPDYDAPVLNTPWFEFKVEEVLGVGATNIIYDEKRYTGTLGNLQPYWHQGPADYGSSLGINESGNWGFFYWMPYELDLSDLMGKKIMLTLSTSDDAYGTHAMYAYLDAYYEYKHIQITPGAYPPYPKIYQLPPQWLLTNYTHYIGGDPGAPMQTPEPATMLLLGLGLMGLAGVRRFRN